jgi:hypothetical protein
MPHKDPMMRRLYHIEYRRKNAEQLKAKTQTEEFKAYNRARMRKLREEKPEMLSRIARHTRMRKRIREGKDPIGTRGVKPRPLAERFWLKVIKHEEGCWEWKGAKHDHGYGKIDKMLASHASWLIHFGPVPDGLEVCHTCDNPECTRPDHLWLGTHGDNMRDAFSKGRVVHIPKTHCKRGHEFTPENTYVWRKHRHCIRCRWMRQRGEI